jgi:hypothetical protein
MCHIPHLKLNDIAAPKLAVDRQVEKGKVSDASGHLQSNSDCPDLAKLQWELQPVSRSLFQGMWLAVEAVLS